MDQNGSEKDRPAWAGPYTGEYDDILYLPHHVSPTRPPMPMSERAAQFSPFAALSGYGDEVREAERLTDAWNDLEEDQTELLDAKIQVLLQAVDSHPEAEITYFRPDAKKEGGAYRNVSGRIEKIDTARRIVVFADGTTIPVAEIVDIRCETLFPDWTDA